MARAPSLLDDERQGEAEQGEGLDQGEADEHERADPQPAASGWREMPSTVLPTRKPMPMPGPACPGHSR